MQKIIISHAQNNNIVCSNYQCIEILKLKGPYTSGKSFFYYGSDRYETLHGYIKLNFRITLFMIIF